MKLVYAFGIALEGERASGEMRQEHRRNAHKIINDLALGETNLGVENFIQIGKLDLTAFNFDERFLFSQLMLPWQILPQATQITMIRDEEIRMSHFSTQQSALSPVTALRAQVTEVLTAVGVLVVSAIGSSVHRVIGTP